MVPSPSESCPSVRIRAPDQTHIFRLQARQSAQIGDAPITYNLKLRTAISEESRASRWWRDNLRLLGSGRVSAVEEEN